jgi:hypothetical protein
LSQSLSLDAGRPHLERFVRFQAAIRPLLFPAIGTMYALQASEAPNERYQRFVTINLGMLRHRLSDRTLRGSIELAVNERLVRSLARWFAENLGAIPAEQVDVGALLRKYGGPGVLDQLLPLDIDNEGMLLP